VDSAAAPSTGSGAWRKLADILGSAEEAISSLALAALVLLPLIEITARRLVGEGIPGSIGYVQNLTLWVGFLGAGLAARDKRHLALSALPSMLKGRWQTLAGIFSSSVATAVATLLAVASVQFVNSERASTTTLGGGLPVWIAEAIMPIGFAVTAARFFRQTPGGWKGRILPLLAVAGCLALSLLPEESRASLLWPGVGIVLAATALGAPVFTLLGGVALLLFYSELVPIAAIPVEAYRIASSPTLPTVPLFTLAGSILAQGGASRRLVRVFRAFFGWIPGGTAIAAVAVSAFFTTFTGASGVTLLALGALLLPILLQDRYGENFSMGIITAGASLGTVFPPCLPVILYGVIAHIAIDRLFLAGLVPGFLLLAMVAVFAATQGAKGQVERTRLSLREAGAALWNAKWDVLLPIFVLFSIFSGYTTLVETAALTALYAFFVEYFLYREINLRKDVRHVFVDTLVMVGGILIILSAAMGFTNYLVDAEIPARGAEWVQAKIHTQWGFLLVVNFFLLIVGCLMDIFSAIVVVVPLIAPIGAAFGVDPVHLGIIFLINMQLGYITPPVGMNLFLASYRFKKSLGEVTRAAIPFLIVMAIGVLLVTYLPALTVGFLHLIGK
jgi:C4-dicarboxylate transporter DctM subunit